jgi:C4-dicarboxylate transporter
MIISLLSDCVFIVPPFIVLIIFIAIIITCFLNIFVPSYIGIIIIINAIIIIYYHLSLSDL